MMTFEEEQRARALAAAIWEQGARHALNHVQQVGAQATVEQLQHTVAEAQAIRQAEQDRAAANARRLAERQPRWRQVGLSDADIEHDLGVLYGGETRDVLKWALEHDTRLAQVMGDAALAPHAHREVDRLRTQVAQHAVEDAQRKERESPGYRPHLPKRPYGASVSDWENSGRLLRNYLGNEPEVAEPEERLEDIVREFAPSAKAFQR